MATFHFPPNPRSIPEDAGILTLTEHLVEVALIDHHAIAPQDISHQCRALLLTHRRQLGLVAYQHQTTVHAVIDELHQVVEQATTAKTTVAETLIGNHRGLIDDKQGIAVQIIVETESTEVASTFLTVNPAVDGIGRLALIEREHLGSTPCGCHQDHLLPKADKGTDHRPRQRGLTRSGGTTQDHHHLFPTVGHESRKDIEGLRLLCRRHHREALENAIFQFVTYHLCAKIVKK